MPKVVIEFDPSAQGDFFGRLPTDARTKNLAFPQDRCPHCGGSTSKTVRYSTEWVPAQRQVLWVDIPVCARAWPPAWLRIIGLLVAVPFIVVLFIFVARIMDTMYGVGAAPVGPLVVSGLLCVVFGAVGLWAVWGYVRVRFAHYHHRSMSFRFIDEGYAREFARLNRGRVGR